MPLWERHARTHTRGSERALTLALARARGGAFTWGKFYTADPAKQVVPVGAGGG